MKTIAIIPTRYHSTRLPAKPLIDIAGKPMIQHVYEQVKKSNVDDVIIACDDKRILDTVDNFNGKAIMTSKHHTNGSSRISEVAQKIDADIIINVQGDEPLISPNAINTLITAFKDKSCICATLKSKIIDVDEINNSNTVKVITDINNNAIYFSRFAIPFVRDNNNSFTYYKHIGIYGFTKDFLLEYSNMPASKLELSESLEQLRILENGYKIKVLETEEQFIGVDTMEDLQKVRDLLL